LSSSGPTWTRTSFRCVKPAHFEPGHRDSVLLAPARFTSCRSTRLPTCGPTYIEMPLLPQVTPEETRAG
jgi:hypothetical protein